MAFPNPFKPAVKKLKKLTGAPSSTIKRWCYEKSKRITPNPFKPHKKKTIKDKKLEVPLLQKLLIQLKDKVNQIIDQTDLVPELEEKVYELERQVYNLTLKLNKLSESHDEDVDDLEEEDDRLEEYDERQDRDLDRSTRRFKRHRHQFGPTVYNPYTGPVRVYTKKPRSYKSGGKTKNSISSSNERQSLIQRIRDKIKSLIGR